MLGLALVSLTRPAGADPVTAERLYDYFVAACGQAGLPTQTGRFAADMQVFLQNDGPVTFWLEV